jgi:hypothetical protein
MSQEGECVSGQLRSDAQSAFGGSLSWKKGFLVQKRAALQFLKSEELRRTSDSESWNCKTSNGRHQNLKPSSSVARTTGEQYNIPKLLDE